MAEDTPTDLTTLVAEVAAAYFANSHVGASDIGPVIEQIARSLAAVGEGETPASTKSAAPPAEQQPTRAQIRKSITPDAIISFEDGRGYKALRRHLSVRGLAPEQYREKWGLPADYPMVAPNYSAARSQMAKNLGLGNRRAPAAEAAPPKARGGRKTTPAPE